MLHPPHGPTIEQEISGEKMDALVRITRKMESALEALQNAAPSEREARLAEAGELAWFFVVQRESMGIPTPAEVLAHYGIPAEVRHKMGPRTSRPSEPNRG